MNGEHWLELKNSSIVWDRRAFMETAYGNPEEALDIVEFTRRRLGFDPNPLQELALRGGRRVIVNCTRQWGKSTMAAVKGCILTDALFRQEYMCEFGEAEGVFLGVDRYGVSGFRTDADLRGMGHRWTRMHTDKKRPRHGLSFGRQVHASAKFSELTFTRRLRASSEMQ